MKIDFSKLKLWVFFIFVFLFTSKYTTGIRYFIFKGGRSSAKSWHVAMLFVKRSFYKDTDQIIFQKNLTGAEKGTRKLIIQTIRRFGLTSFFYAPKSRYTITNIKTECVIEFAEFKDEDKIKGAEGFRHYWIDEADQCPKESFTKIDDTFRTYEDTTGFLTFNPVSPFVWIKTDFIDPVINNENCIDVEYSYYFKSGDEATESDYDLYLMDSEKNKEVKRLVSWGLWVCKELNTIVHHSTYLVNTKLPISYMKNKILQRTQNFVFWCINDMGEFGSPEGLVLPNFEIRDFDDSQFDYKHGLDWGWTHPFFLLPIHVSESQKEIYVGKEFAGAQLRNSTIIEHIKRNNYGRILADSAEPKSINEFLDAGIDISGVNKSLSTVEDQLRILQDYKIISLPGNTHFNRQAYLYKYPDNGKKDTPIKINDDGYDALRYALNDWLNGSSGFDSESINISTGFGF